MGEYYDLIMKPSQSSFANYFNKCWNNQLDDFNKPYNDAIQLRIGNQLRPKLTCWGAALNTINPQEINLPLVAEIASYIEMLHKASIIIDDILDNDNARHEQKTFHVEFGREKAIVFALALLSRGTAGINSAFQENENQSKSVLLFSNTIYDMARGGLAELELDSSSRFNISTIQKIISLETISLIKNSFLLGYWSTCPQDYNIEKTITEIGNNCGYIFQILNDLEPFASVDKNIAYKGSFNIDVDRKRKNIVVAYIFGSASSNEKQMLTKVKGEDMTSLIIKLYQKYSVYDEVYEEAQNLTNQTHKLIARLKQSSKNKECCNDFSLFVDEMVNICFSKLA